MKSKIEHQHQVALIKWANNQRITPANRGAFEEKLKGARLIDFLFAIPNGGSRTKSEGASLKREGVKAGVSDLMLAVPSCGFCGLFIELKKPPADKAKGTGAGKVTQEQVYFSESMIKVNHAVVFCWGMNEAVETIMAYLSNTEDGRDFVTKMMIPNFKRKME